MFPAACSRPLVFGLKFLRHDEGKEDTALEDKLVLNYEKGVILVDPSLADGWRFGKRFADR